MSLPALPAWAKTMREIFRAETISQFVLYGNIRDLVEHGREGGPVFLPLRQYLADVLFEPFGTVLFYDRGRGIRVARGADRFQRFLQGFDRFHGTRFSTDSAVGANPASGASADPSRGLEMPGLLPRAPDQALELIDRFLGSVTARGPADDSQPGPPGVAVVIDYANYIVPRGDSAYLAASAANLIKILHWSDDPGIAGANIATVLLSDSLLDLNASLVDGDTVAKIPVSLPDRQEIESFVKALTAREPDFKALSRVEEAALAGKLVGLSRVDVKNLILRALRNKAPLTDKYLTQVKKETIEKEAQDKVEFVESRRTLDDVAGHAEAKAWLRDDAKLLRRGATAALPMGYLVTGRIGTGKTFLIECFAGECGVPFVALKNFRDKWVGATEGNLEKVFSILHALGQVVVFVDEADQFAGRRGGGDGDSGLSGRIYGMLAREMADTRNRGKILWIFATSRPDLLEVDLKRQGRLDVHIPLFPPEDEKGRKELFLAMARKLKVNLSEAEVPELAFGKPISGNELEGLLMRALREFELQEEPRKRTLPEVVKDVVAGFRPSAHTAQLELMDLLAVRECTDDRFLPAHFRMMQPLAVERRIAELQAGLG